MPESCQTNGSGITLHGLSLVTVQALLKTMRLLCITASVGRSRSVKNAADTKLAFHGLILPMDPGLSFMAFHDFLTKAGSSNRKA